MIVRWEVLRARMRARRIELGLTQAELGQRMNRSQDYVSVLENSVRSIPNLVTYWRWVEALGGVAGPSWGEAGERRHG